MIRYALYLIRRIVYSVLAFAALRVAFLLYQSLGSNAALSGAPWLERMHALLWGLRFDLSASLSILGPYLIWSLLPLPWVTGAFWRAIGSILYFVPHFIFFALEAIDLEYFRQSGRRMTIEVLGLRQDAMEQSANLVAQYAWVAIFYVLFVLGFFLFVPRYAPAQGKRPRWWLNIAFFPILGALALLGIRGTLATRPLAPGHAFRYSVPALGNVAASTSFVFIKSIQAHLEGQSLTRHEYFDRKDPAQAARYAELTRALPGAPRKQARKQNVVIFILESFPSEVVGFANDGKGYTPFLDSLAKAGLVFQNAYANARRSINSLPGILASIPDWLGPPYIMSNYQSNSIYGLGHLLRQNGYAAMFFHGAKNGSMGFDYFSGLAGFEHYYGVNEFKKERPKATEDIDESGWGVYDEPFFQYAAEHMSAAAGQGKGATPRPFGAVIYTLTSHPPYHLPKAYEGKFPKGTHPLHPTIGYTDYAIKRFMETARKEPWFKDTLFVFTSDHTFELQSPKYNTLLGRFDVPLLFYHPGQKLTAPDPMRVTHHLDIFPTVADLIGLPLKQRLPFGRSLIARVPGRALLMEGDTYLIVEQDWGVSFNPDAERSMRYFRRATPDTDAVPLESERIRLQDSAEALVQFFRDGLIDNALYERRRPPGD